MGERGVAVSRQSRQLCFGRRRGWSLRRGLFREVTLVVCVGVHSAIASGVFVGHGRLPGERRDAVRYAERIVVSASWSGSPAERAASPSSDSVVLYQWPSSAIRHAAQNRLWFRAPSG